MVIGKAQQINPGRDKMVDTQSQFGEVQNVKKSTVVIRGAASKTGRLNFYFKEQNGPTLYMNKNWFSNIIPAGADIVDIGNIILNADTQIFTYSEVLPPYSPAPDPQWWVKGWPTYYNEATNQTVDVLYQPPTVEMGNDLYGDKLTVTFYTNRVRFLKYTDMKLSYVDAEVDVTMQSDEDLEGFGSLMITSDYTVYITSPILTSTYDPTEDDYNSLNFMVNSWLTGIDSNIKEDLGMQAPYFRIPVYPGEGLLSFQERIDGGDEGYDPETGVGNPLKPIACDSLSDQINTFFNRVADTTGLLQRDSFTVITTNTELVLSINISTISDQIQHQVSCYTYGAPQIKIQVLCNSYFVNDNVFELRSYYDMYGIDKPIGTQTPDQSYKPLAYGFKFNLDFITEYSEQESSSIDVTPIPGQSSAKAIGIDSVGCVRDINISGIRVDNSNIWMFHVPWQESGKNHGIIYTGTSNWGWVKFMKGILGTFQMTSGPYRLIMMTIPSSSQMQYYPTRQGVYQYSDGTIVLLAGWEDMCYVMVENFTYSRSEEMFNAIQYSIKLKRVAPLFAGR